MVISDKLSSKTSYEVDVNEFRIGCFKNHAYVKTASLATLKKSKSVGC